MQQQTAIARLIDLDGTTATLLAGNDSLTIEWPVSAVPVEPGAVYEVVLLPSFQVLRLLARNTTGRLDPAGDALRWRKSNAGRSRMANLHDRHIIRRAVRDYLDGQNFIEVDTPLLVRGTTPDAELESFAVADRYLVTSAEYQIKRMEIGGFDRIYTLTQNFRIEETAGDANRFRNPEFTMLEWARVGAELSVIEHDLEQLTLAAFRALGHTGHTLNYQGHAIDLAQPWDRITVLEAITQATGFAITDFAPASLAAAAQSAGLDVLPEWLDDQSFLFSLVMDHAQKSLGFTRPVFVQQWPSFQTSSAPDSGEQNFVMRSEAFIAGIELSDGFPSQTDPARQRAAFALQAQRRMADGHAPVCLDPYLLAAMEQGFPAGAGMAMGFDRLVMLLCNATHIREVLAFHWDEV